MEKFIVFAVYAQHNEDDGDLGLNHWLVGQYDTLKECYTEGKKHIEESMSEFFNDMCDDDPDRAQAKFENYMSELMTYEYKPADFSLQPIVIHEVDYSWDEGYCRERFQISVIKLA